MCKKMNNTIQTFSNKKCKNHPLWWYGDASVPMAWVICIYVKVPLMQVGILERHILPSRRRLFPGTTCLFQQDNARPHSAGITRAWLRRNRLCVLDWLACSPDLSPIENVCRIMKRRIRTWWPRTVEQLKSCICSKWAKILLSKLQQLISLVCKWLQSVIKRKGDVTQW